MPLAATDFVIFSTLQTIGRRCALGFAYQGQQGPSSPNTCSITKPESYSVRRGRWRGWLLNSISRRDIKGEAMAD
jgi:hypothetical protein